MQTSMTAPPFELAHTRLEAGNYIPGSGSDGRLLCVANGSGGLAGINQLGKLWGLKEKGILSVIDGWEGDSIGGINAGIGAADQIQEATEEGFYALGKRWFVNPWRALLIGRQAVNMRTLSLVMEPVLDIEKIASSPVPVTIGVSRLRPLKAMSVDLTKIERSEIIPWMMRGAHLPIAGGAAPRDKDGMPYADPGLTSMGPVDRAVQKGYTDIIYLSCNPLGEEHKHPWQVAIAGAWAMRHDSAAILKYNNTVNRQIESRQPYREGSFRYGQANVVGFYLPSSNNKSPEDALPTLWTTDPGRLRYGFDRAVEYMKNCLDVLMPELKPAIS